jgi:acyl transferase domain-containing protein
VLDDAYHYLLEHGIDGKHRSVINGKKKTNTHSVSADISNGLSNGKSNGKSNRYPKRVFESNTNGVTNGVQNKNAFMASARRRLYVWSYHEEPAAERYALPMIQYLRGRSIENEETFLHDLSYTLAERRSRLQWRTYCTASSIYGLAEKLSEGLIASTTSPKVPTLAFVFTGQGAQWYAMGRELFAAYADYRETLLAADKYFKTVLRAPWSLIGELEAFHTYPTYTS